MTRSPLGLLVVALLGVLLGACGGAGKGTVSTPGISTSAAGSSTSTTNVVTNTSEASSLRGLRGDEDDDDTPSNTNYTGEKDKNDKDADSDNDSKATVSKSYYDSDDGSVRDYGQAANAAESGAVRALVKRYYAAAAAEDGASACSTMYTRFANAIPEDYGRGAGPRYSRGNTCAVVMSKLFMHSHRELASPIVVTNVRVSGNEGRALIGSKTAPASYLVLKRERGVWKVKAVFGLPLP